MVPDAVVLRANQDLQRPQCRENKYLGKEEDLNCFFCDAKCHCSKKNPRFLPYNFSLANESGQPGVLCHSERPTSQPFFYTFLTLSLSVISPSDMPFTQAGGVLANLWHSLSLLHVLLCLFHIRSFWCKHYIIFTTSENLSDLSKVARIGSGKSKIWVQFWLQTFLRSWRAWCSPTFLDENCLWGPSTMPKTA